MERISSARQRHTEAPGGYVLPVVVRGRDRLPEAIRSRLYLDFSEYLAFGPRQFKSKQFAGAMRKLAGRVYELCKLAETIEQP